MTLQQFWVGFLLVAFTSTLCAQSTSAEISPIVPDVRNLPADWWNYVSGVPSSEREGRLTKVITGIREAATEDLDRHQDVADLTADIESLVPIYIELLDERPPADAPLAGLREQYTFRDVLELHSQRREAALELKLMRDFVQRESRSLPQAEKRLSTQKAKYLVMPSTDTNRLAAGLRIISERLRVSIQSEQLRVGKAQLEIRVQKLASVDDELAHAFKQLVIDEKQIADAESNAATYRERAQTAHREVTSIRTRQHGTVEADLTKLRALRATKLIAAEAHSTENEIIAKRYALQAAYLAARFDPTDAAFEVLHDERVAADTLVSETRDAIQAWREAAARERTLALQSLSSESSEAIDEQRVASANDISRIVAQTEAEISRIEFIGQQAAAFLAAETGRFQDFLAHGVDFVQASWVKVRGWASSSLFEINETPVTLAGLLRVVLILIVAVWISKAVRHGLEQLGRRNVSMNRSSLYILGRIFHYVILGTAFLIALSTLGLDFTKLAILAGALGVGIGFGLQAIFSNFISGIIVLVERSLKVGDFVELESGVTGEVREINIRSTLITTNDNIDILVPNSEFVNGRVINWTLRDAYRRTRIPFGVAYGTDKDLVRKAVLEAASEIPFTLKNHPGRDPQVWLVEFGDSSLNFELVVWLTTDAVTRPGAVHAAYTWAIESALGKYGIEIPFPQRDLHVRSFFGRKDESGLEWFDDAKTPRE